MKFEQIETGIYRAHSDGTVYTIVRANRDLWTLDLASGGRADVARVTSDTKSSLRKWAVVYDADPYASRWPELDRITRTQRLMAELDPNIEVRDSGWVSGPPALNTEVIDRAVAQPEEIGWRQDRREYRRRNRQAQEKE